MSLRGLILSCALVPLIAAAITPDEIRAIDEQIQHQKQLQAQRAQPGEVDKLLPAQQPAAAAPASAAASAQQSTKYASPASSTASNTPAAKSAANPAARSAAAERVRVPAVGASAPIPGPAAAMPAALPVAEIPPPAPADAITTDAVAPNLKRYFGIPLGTWFRVELTRSISSAENGQIELTVADDVPGAHRILPAGSLLFADKTYNDATKRLDCRLVRGITPKGYEFTLHASCYDLQRQAGLNGIVNVNQQAVASRSVKSGVLSAMGAAAGAVAGTSSIATQGVRGAVGSITSDAQQANEETAPPIYTIYVSPQVLLVRMDDSL
jgi:hypothetical protein